MIAINIYLIKHCSTQKHLLPFHGTIKLKEIGIINILQKWKVITNS